MKNYIRATSLQGIDALINELGGDVPTLLTHCDISVEFSNLESQFLEYRDYISLLNHCAQQLNCSDFGLQLAARQRFDILGPIALVAQSSTTLGDVLAWVVKYLHVHSPAISIKQTPAENANGVLLSFDILLQPLPNIAQVTELSIGLMVGVIRELTHEKWSPNEVYFPQKIRGNQRAYQKHFGCHIAEFKNLSGIVFDEEALNLLINTRNTPQFEASLRYLKAQGEQTVTLEDKVAQLIKPLMAIHQCDNDTIAQILGLHTRQLHRLLSNENTSFVKIKNKVRSQLAWHYLTQSQLQFSHISDLLGYQEQATFSASCQRWFSKSPSAIRNVYSDSATTLLRP